MTETTANMGIPYKVLLKAAPDEAAPDQDRPELPADYKVRVYNVDAPAESGSGKYVYNSRYKGYGDTPVYRCHGNPSWFLVRVRLSTTGEIYWARTPVRAIATTDTDAVLVDKVLSSAPVPPVGTWGTETTVTLEDPAGRLRMVLRDADTKQPVAAKWTVDGRTYDNGYTAILVPGTYTVTFSALAGYSAPAPATIEVLSGKSKTVTVNYYAE